MYDYAGHAATIRDLREKVAARDKTIAELEQRLAEGVAADNDRYVEHASALSTELARVREALEAEYDRGRRDILNAILAPNPAINAKLASWAEREPDPAGRLPFDVVLWVTEVAEQLGIEPKEDAADPQVDICRSFKGAKP